VDHIGGPIRSHVEVARILGTSRQYVQKVERRALVKLRNALIARRLVAPSDLSGYYLRSRGNSAAA